MDNPVTLNELITAVRELTFDRFVIPAFAIKSIPDCSITIDSKTAKKLSITKTVEDETTTLADIDLSVYDTFDKLLQKLIEDEIVLSFTPYFKGDEPVSDLLKVTDRPLSSDFTAFRRYFFSDEEINRFINWYYSVVLQIRDVEITDDITSLLVRPSERHLTIWCAYQLVDKRRMYESAAQSIGQTYTDGSNYVGSESSKSPLQTTVQIGSVFSITENESEGYFVEDFGRVGSDNIWGDRYSFWYKLMLYLRQLLEESFHDYSLRKDTVIPGNITLLRELDFRSYYDSYPFTLSPLSRGIVSKNP